MTKVKPKVDPIKSKYMFILLAIKIELFCTTYSGLVYYEEKGVEDLVTFTATKDLDALLQVHTCSYAVYYIAGIFGQIKIWQIANFFVVGKFNLANW